MRFFLIILLLFLQTTLVIGQKDLVNRLVSQLDNNKLVGTCNRVWIIKNNSREVDTLIKLSQLINNNLKPTYKNIITDELIALLTDTCKGIIAHYTLCNIWTKYISLQSEFLSDSILTVRYTYNELEFYWNSEKLMFAQPEQLLKVKDVWKKRLGR